MADPNAIVRVEFKTTRARALMVATAAKLAGVTQSQFIDSLINVGLKRGAERATFTKKGRDLESEIVRLSEMANGMIRPDEEV